MSAVSAMENWRKPLNLLFESAAPVAPAGCNNPSATQNMAA